MDDAWTTVSILLLCACVWLLADKVAELEADVEFLKDAPQVIPVIMMTRETAAT